MKRILVIGGTGHIGRAVVTQLIAAGARVRAMVRDPATAGLPPQVDVSPGDLTLPDSLDGPLLGIDAVFLVWTAPPAAAIPALARITAHAPRVVYLSAPVKTPHPFFQASLPNQSSVLHEAIERLIQKSPTRACSWRSATGRPRTSSRSLSTGQQIERLGIATACPP